MTSAAVRRLISGSPFCGGRIPSPEIICVGCDGPLDEGVRNLVEQRTGIRPQGPIRLLTQLRHFGYYFSPLNLFYCFDATGTKVEVDCR